MKRPTFVQGALVAALLAIAAAVFVTLFASLLGIGFAVRLVIPCVAFAYLAYLVRQSGLTTGRVTAVAAWAMLALAAWWAGLPLGLYVLAHAGAIWLIRSLYFYSGAVPAVMDLALSGLGVVAATWALTRTGSVFLAVWSFFLVQALFVVIPKTIRRRNDRAGVIEDDDFERARRQAEAALRQLITR